MNMNCNGGCAWSRACIVALSIFLFAGCAACFHDSMDKINLASSPPGAKFYVDGKLRGVTPDEVALENKSPHSIEFRKEGYTSKTVAVGRSIGVGWVIADLLFDGIMIPAFIGDAKHEEFHQQAFSGTVLIMGSMPVLADAMTGAWYSVDDDDVSVILEKEQAAAK